MKINHKTQIKIINKETKKEERATGFFIYDCAGQLEFDVYVLYENNSGTQLIGEWKHHLSLEEWDIELI